MIMDIFETENKRISAYDIFAREKIYRILDQGIICHIGFSIDDLPYVMPTAYVRCDDNLLIYGSSKSLMIRALSWEINLCLTVTLIEKSLADHLADYQSVVIFGKARYVSEEARRVEIWHLFKKRLALKNHIDSLKPSLAEIDSMAFLSIPLSGAKARICDEARRDNSAENNSDIWAGLIALEQTKTGLTLRETMKNSVVNQIPSS